MITGPEKTVSDFHLQSGEVAGYIIIRASTMDELVEIAKSAPNLKYGGSVEIRSTIPPAQ